MCKNKDAYMLPARASIQGRISQLKNVSRYINRRDKGEGCELTMDIETRYTRPFILREETRARILEEQIKCKKRHGKSRAIHVTFKVEDTICMQENPEQVGYSAKL
ncbi:uncharacterized protein LOC117180167 isoform X2 [Belonocnema kinseyi]|uniref:uncharacterized protein LOC117180167 isoform X2 n=1 Tax=Belonocnema kinseyi TaxID=2817044 RepID=UPI00143CC35E|nr:uncharacterized protein LOC117180167 isoform X2 [Belonocnema kinseyi]